MKTVIGLTSFKNPPARGGQIILFSAYELLRHQKSHVLKHCTRAERFCVHSDQTCQHNALKYFGISLLVPYVTVLPHFLKSCPKAHSRRVSTAVSYFTPHPRLLNFGALARLVKIQSKILQKKNTLKKEKRNCTHLLTSLGFPYDESISWAISSC